MDDKNGIQLGIWTLQFWYGLYGVDWVCISGSYAETETMTDLIVRKNKKSDRTASLDI